MSDYEFVSIAEITAMLNRARQEGADRASARQDELHRQRAEEDELRRRFEASEREHDRKFAQLQAELARRNTNLMSNREQADVNAYKAAKITELRDPKPEDDHFGILPELEDLIQGSTREEVDTALKTMIEKTRSVVESVWNRL